ncbi:MAG: sigma 54-interacting transcriptional regulator [Chitinispirillaceae bacterium]|jgi:Nif-specific regulatory protein|nr:sigma 54-interacting transcriptional regulator [Chitinispirillaceae bacterium]
MIISELKADLGFNGLSVLYHVARVLSQGGELGSIMEEILEILEIHAGMNRGMISILSPDSSELVVDAARGISESEKKKGRYRPGEGVTGQVASTGKPILVPQIRDFPEFLDKTGARSNLAHDNVAFLCVPIKAGDAIIGTLSVDRVTDSRPGILDNELRFLEAIGDIIAQVVNERRENQARISALQKENLELRRTLEDIGKPSEMVGNSSLMREIFRQIAQVAPSPTSVLIRGETGTGKELIARAIHSKSLIKDGPFIVVNCAALPESLLESELFGHEKGSFTGAVNQRIGRFEAANNGTLFLDEIGEMTAHAQGRLLRAIQEKEIQRVGGTHDIHVNVRLICATNRDLETDVKEGRFREDLYYRINVFSILMPPLRNRGADALLLADHFVKKYCKVHNKIINRISTPAIDMLSAYHWPGNVRELENVIERAVLVAAGDSVEGHDLPPTLQMKDLTKAGVRKDTFEGLVAAYEREIIIEALKDSRGNQTEAAKLLGTTKRIIQYKITKNNIDYTRYRH